MRRRQHQRRASPSASCSSPCCSPAWSATTPAATPTGSTSVAEDKGFSRPGEARAGRQPARRLRAPRASTTTGSRRGRRRGRLPRRPRARRRPVLASAVAPRARRRRRPPTHERRPEHGRRARPPAALPRPLAGAPGAGAPQARSALVGFMLRRGGHAAGVVRRPSPSTSRARWSSSSRLAGAADATSLKRMVVEVPFVLFALLLPFVAHGPQHRGARAVGLSEPGLLAAWGAARQGHPRRARQPHPGRDHRAAATCSPGCERLRMPDLLVQIMGFMVRYLDVVTAEMRPDARRPRVARLRPPATPRHWPVLARSPGALFIRSYERGERVHLAMLVPRLRPARMPRRQRSAR